MTDHMFIGRMACLAAVVAGFGITPTGATVPFPIVPIAPHQIGITLAADTTAEQELWNSVRTGSDQVQVLLFLRAYPDGKYQQEARDLLAALTSASPAPPPEKPIAETAEPVVTQDAGREQTLIEFARTSNTAEAYRTYLQEFPEGTFAELAKLELDTLSKPTQKPTAAPEPTEPVANSEPEILTFDGPLSQSEPTLAGKSIADLILGSPLHPPIEGIPEELWKGQDCSNCHAWTKEALCTQGETYNKTAAPKALDKKHPYGGAFKRTIRVWAAQGCQ